MRIALLLGIGMLTAAAAPADLVIRGGTIHTGDGRTLRGDVAIRGERIVSVGKRTKARRVIDATGMIVAPGFIDPHTHVGDDLASDDPAVRLVPAFLMQGVTTAFVGNDGYGRPVKDVFALSAAKPKGINYAAYIGFGAVRQAVVGAADRAPTDTELAAMKAMVATSMCEGAMGLSTGLFYAPQSFAQTGEVVALAKEAGKRGGVYDSHIRDESSYGIGFAAAIDEAITIGREGGLPAHIAHIKALGVDVHGQAPAIIAKVEAARAAGQKVTADQYPWSASGTSLTAALVPRWAQDGGRPALLTRFDDTSLAAKLRADMAENLRKRGGAESLLITEGPHKGQRLSAIAATRKEDAITAAVAVIRQADPGVASFNQTEGDIAAFMKRPWVMTGSDASAGHPRLYGSFARKYAKYVKADKVLSLSDFIHRSSTLTADTFGLKDRGRIRAGAFADIVVFDPETYAERATYEQPMLTAAGVQTVLVNGMVAVDRGKLTGKAGGRALPRTPRPGSCP